MIPDPTTNEGKTEIERRLKKIRREAADARRRAYDNADEEPSGVLTNPNEIDFKRDLKNDD